MGNDAPGPGAYAIKTSIGSGQKNSIYARRPDTAPTKGKEAPGPGSYMPNSRQNAPAFA
jgi:Sperm-tail PG-rich repeat